MNHNTEDLDPELACERCEKREGHRALVVVWRESLCCEDTDAEPAWVCRRCATALLEAWDALVAKECRRGDL